MFLFRRLRRGALFGATVVGTAVLGLAVAGPASATVAAPANNTIVGSGSNTAYATLSALANLFNESQGCNLVVPSGTTQPLNYSCPTGGSLPAGDPPFGYGDPQSASPYSENPFNDVVEVEPRSTRSAGITQLENQGSHTTNTAPVNFASSARGPEPGCRRQVRRPGSQLRGLRGRRRGLRDLQAGPGAATAASTISGLSQAQLQAIWSGTDKCWSDVGATGPNANDLINPYSIVTTSADHLHLGRLLVARQLGDLRRRTDDLASGHIAQVPERSQGDLHRAPLHQLRPVAHDHPERARRHHQQQRPGVRHHVLLYGRYEQQKSSKPFKKTKLGSIGTPPVAPTETTILNGTYPVPQNLYNVYSDGTNSDIPVSNPATINFASENGFLCKPNTAYGRDDRGTDHGPSDRPHLQVGDRVGDPGPGLLPARRPQRERAVPGGHADHSCRRDLELHLVLVLPVRHAPGLKVGRRRGTATGDHRRQHRPSMICLRH